MDEKLKGLEERRARVLAGGGPKRVAAQHAKGKKTARERIEALLDQGSFVELDAFVEHRCTDLGMAGVEAPGRGGHRLRDHQRKAVYVFAQDFTVTGGTGEMHAAKICKAKGRAVRVGCPCIGSMIRAGRGSRKGWSASRATGKFYRKPLASGVVPRYRS